jgi:hypothetical protein
MSLKTPKLLSSGRKIWGIWGQLGEICGQVCGDGKSWRSVVIIGFDIAGGFSEGAPNRSYRDYDTSANATMDNPLDIGWICVLSGIDATFHGPRLSSE